MTYFIKQDKFGRGHVFTDGMCECDESEHFDYPLVAKGLKVKHITCPKCLGMVPDIVRREMAIAMAQVVG